MKIRTSILFSAAILLASCAAPPPVVAPRGETRYLIDPRIGWNAAPGRGIERRFDDAWRSFLTGDLANTRARLAEIADRQPDYAPATLANAAIGIRQGNYVAAHAIVDNLVAHNPQYIAALVYAAELDVAENRMRSAYDRYRQFAGQADAPKIIAERIGELQTRLFDQLYGGAINAPPAQAIPLLQEALAVVPTASAARLLLAQELVAARQFEEARKALDPLLNTSAATQPEVQETLAEIDVGRGRYQDAINRYEQLAHGDATGRYSRRLEEIKEQFAAANMPPQIVTAMNTEALTRADLAVLVYWDIASIRFAQNVPTPPIATDIVDGAGRDEMIRAIALGILPVDPITRRVYPEQVVTGSALARVAARILTLRGAPCARQVPAAGGPDGVLNSCGISNPADGPAADMPVSGQTASALLVEVDRAISR